MSATARILAFPPARQAPPRRSFSARIPLTGGAATASSARLFRQARRGDQDALELLLRRHVPALRRWIRARLPAWAREVASIEFVEDTLLEAIDAQAVGGPATAQTAFRMAVLNRAHEVCRGAGRTPDLPSPLERAIGRQAVERYERALKELADTDRELIVARIEMGCSYADVAKLLGASPTVARGAVARALVRLAEGMRDAG